MGGPPETIQIPLSGGVQLEADVGVLSPARGVVLFAHGSGSGRRSPRNRSVAAHLRRVEIGTVLVDLLTPEEDRIDARTAEHRFDIGLLSTRLIALVDWVAHHELTAGLGIGLFGASTGAAAALVAAAARPDSVTAVVSRGGRPDLAGAALGSVDQPTLLIVGEHDEVVLDLNRRAMEQLGGEVRLEIVAGASHLFEEPGALEQVAQLAGHWFVEHIEARRQRPRY